MIEVKSVRYLTMKDAAARLNLSAKTLYTYIDKGHLPPPEVVKQGRRKFMAFSEKYLREAERRIAADR